MLLALSFRRAFSSSAALASLVPNHLISRLERISASREEAETLLQQLDPRQDKDAFVEASKSLTKVQRVSAIYDKIESSRKELDDLNSLHRESADDPELRKLISAEIKSVEATLKEEVNAAWETLGARQHDNSNSADDDGGGGAVILEVRAGTGGAEAQLFAFELWEMYRLAARHSSWSWEQLSLQEGQLPHSLREASASVGVGIGRLRFETGTHRVQRVPLTEAGNKLQTSTATVAVLRDVEGSEDDILLDEKSLRIDTYRSSGAGGQHVNTTDSAIRVTHLPTGIVVTCQDERSQHKNKAKALKVLRARIWGAQREREQAMQAEERKAMIGTGDRAEKIRTYHFPQDRVTQHVPVSLTQHGLRPVMQGGGLVELMRKLEEATATEEEGSE